MFNPLPIVLSLIASFFLAASPAKQPAFHDRTLQQYSIAETLPSFKMLDVDGKQVNLSDFKGKKVFLNIWATWCPPCRAELPSIKKLYQAANKQDAVFIMLSVDRDFSVAKNFAQQQKLGLPIYYPLEGFPPLLETSSIPVTFIFNEKGNLIKKKVGMDDYGTAGYISMFK